MEAQLLNFQLSRYPLFSHLTEFHDFFVFNENDTKVKIYFTASHKPWPPKAHILLDEIDKDIEQGWYLKCHLHNHFSEKDGNYIGILAPSLADAHYYKMLRDNYNVKQALITNGFHTVAIDNEEFEKFESH